MLLAFLIAAAPPSFDAGSWDALAEADTRLVTIGRRLAKGGAGLCRGALSNPGWTIEDSEQFPPELRPAVRVGMRLGSYPTIVAVEAASAAERAGVKAGDELLGIGEQLVQARPASTAKRTRQQALEAATASALAEGQAVAKVRRGERTLSLRIPAEPGCATDFLMGRGRGLRAASSNGAQVAVSAQIIDFVHSDDELALVLAHELAHNILGHNRGQASLRIAGEDRSGARGRDREREADRWALYLMARAGYDVSVAPGFWRRWGAKTSFGLLSDGSHPDWRDRASRAEAEIARIRTERAAGRDLIP